MIEWFVTAGRAQEYNSTARDLPDLFPAGLPFPVVRVLSTQFPEPIGFGETFHSWLTLGRWTRTL